MQKLFAIAALLAPTLLAADLPVMQPKDLVAQLSTGAHPTVLHVGPASLFRNGRHIPGAIYAGPGVSPEGIELLKSTADALPRDRDLLIYCGCCPWDRCPNIKPAIEALRAMGFTKVKAIFLETGFKADWADKHYPTEPAQ